MIKNSMGACIVFVLGLALAIPAFAADELFDTAEATKHLEQGVTLIKAKKYDAAVKEFEESAAINPDAEAYYYMGYAYYLKGRAGDEPSRKKSRELFDKAYEIDPNFSPLRYKPNEPFQPGERMKKEAPDAAQPQEGGTMNHQSQPEPQAQPAEQPKP